MKKLFLAAVVAVCGLTGVNAQSTNFEAGAFVGFPMGDAGDTSSFNFGINAAYYWEVSAGFQAGVTAGYDYWVAKEYQGVKGDGTGFIPIAATAKYGFAENFFGGVDLGYAIGASKGNDGGFYYKPRVGYSAASFNVYGFYKGISSKYDYGYGSKTFTVSSIGLGFDYKF